MKQQRSMRLEAEEKKKQSIQTSIAVVVSAVVLGLVIWNQGFFDDKRTFSIDGTNYNHYQVQQYYTDALYGALMGNFSPEEGGADFNFSDDAQNQAYSADKSWHDFFVEEACRKVATIHATLKEAKSNNFILPQEGVQQLADIQKNLDTQWIGYASNKKSFLRMQYDMTEAEYMDMTTMEVTANFYQLELYDSYEYPDSDYEAFYEENQDSLDEITYSQIQYSVTKSYQYDDEGNALDMSEEEEAMHFGLVAMASAESEKALDALDDGDDFATVSEEFSENGSVTAEEATVHSTMFSGSDSVSSWILDPEREEGDYTRTEDEIGDTTRYTITLFHDRSRAESKVADIRHILIPANTEEPTAEATEEQWDAAYDQAEALLDQWIADGSDSEAFGLLAEEHSADSGSATNGGLMEDVTIYDNYVEDFLAWYSDPARKAGDTGIVKNTGSSIQGWHIMYFQDWGLPLWENDTMINLKNESIAAWQEEILEYVNENIQFVNTSNIQSVSLFG